jgi:hypothetical protein
LISIASTAIGKIRSAGFVSHLYRVFHELVRNVWNEQRRNSQQEELKSTALGMAYWLMQPVSKHLSSMITSQERLRRRRGQSVFIRADYVKEVFEMSYGDWKGDYEAVRKFARAVASGIYHARMVKEQNAEDRRKAWYDEVTMLRSAPSAKAFLERAMILIEQGHREHSQVGTVHRGEAYDPQSLLDSIGTGRSSFEGFRDLFRMYLVQESTYQAKEELVVDGSPESPAEDEQNQSEGEDQ